MLHDEVTRYLSSSEPLQSRYIPLVSAFLWRPGAFLPRPEDRRQPPFLDQLYTSNGGCSSSIRHRVGTSVVRRDCCVEAAGWQLHPRPAGAALPPRYARAISRSPTPGAPRSLPRSCRSQCLWTPRPLRHARRAHRALPDYCATPGPN